MQGTCSLSSSPGTLTYRTSWPDSAPASASQVIQLLNGPGVVVRTDSVNRGGAASSEITLPNVPAGVYQARIQLFSGPNGGGSLLGVASAMADLCTSATAVVQTSASLAPASLRLFPSEASVQQLQTVRFVPMAFQPGGAAFADESQYQLEVQGGIGSLNSNRVFTAQSIGSGSIRARYGAGGPEAQSPVAVSERNVVRRKWTILVYMNAANDLFFASDLNVNQMEQVAGNPDVQFVVQWKQAREIFPSSSFDGVRRYLVKPDTSGQVVSELLQNDLRGSDGRPLDMGSPQTLNDFIKWGQANFPSDRTCVIVWNHGSGWKRSPADQPQPLAVSFDDQFGTSIQTWEFDQAFAGVKMDVLAWDASLMQMLEVAYEARPYADFIVGSEESPPAEGYPYDKVFASWRDNPDADTKTLTKSFVDAMLNHPPYASRKITQSVLESSRLPAVATALTGLANSLLAAMPGVSGAVQGARNGAQAYSPNQTRTYRDLIGAAGFLRDDSTSPQPVKDAASALISAAQAAIVWEGHNANSAGSRGISFDFSTSGSFAALASDYGRLKLAQDTTWDSWLAAAP